MAVLNYFSVPDILYLQSYICKVKLLSISDAYYLNTDYNFHMNYTRQFMQIVNIFVLYMYFVATKIYSHFLA